MNKNKPYKLTNVCSKVSSVDTLYQSAIEPVQCEARLCAGSLMRQSVGTTKHRRTTDEIIVQAKNFLDQYYTSIKRVNSPTHIDRWNQVKSSIIKHGTYQLKETELIYGAKLAWRNASRCIGRIQWSKLQVFDVRTATTAKEMFDAICNHIKYATNKGNLRSAITIFPQRTGDSGDFRIWNQQLISYAGYPDPDRPGHIIGDPVNVEFTQICLNLGWKPGKTNWDILPIVVSSAGQDPQLFVIPEELILRVPLEHPNFKWFKELNLQWYAVPAVSSMLFDVGGIEFPAAPFSGWYMGTEIACRDLCDVSRFNILKTVADKMGLDTRSNMTLWKDAALVEVNRAVIDSYQKLGVTIVDHHTAAESFMKHLENEQRLRGGCPADWVWIVPPTAGSLTPVFHQEMIDYRLKPSFEYQEPAWKSHSWNISPNGEKSIVQARKKKFKEIARAVKFTSNLFGKALSKRVKATILYATETGRSEEYAKRLEQIFSFAFNVTVMCMDSYDIFQLEHETLLLIVTSTFGNGDPPENGESFARQLQAIKVTGDTTPDIESVRSVSTSLLRISTLGSYEGRETPPNDIGSSQIGPLSNISIHNGNSLELERLKLESDVTSKIILEDGKLLKESDFKKTEITKSETTLQSNGHFTSYQAYKQFCRSKRRRFAVFGLGSSAYPNFCAFAKYLDNMLGELGGERIHKLITGDELCGQEQSFNQWSKDVFAEACNVFCLSDEINMNDVMKTATLKPKIWSVQSVKLVPLNVTSNGPKSSTDVAKALAKSSNRKVIPFHLVSTVNLHRGGDKQRQTIRVILELDKQQYVKLLGDQQSSTATSTTTSTIASTDSSTVTSTTNSTSISSIQKQPNGHLIGYQKNGETNVSLTYSPGDHLGIFPENSVTLVKGIMSRLNKIDFTKVYQIMFRKSNDDNGNNDNIEYVPHEKLPTCSIEEALTRYLDITTPPTQQLLSLLSSFCKDNGQKSSMEKLANDSERYEEWKAHHYPNLLELLTQFDSLDPPAEIILTQLPMLQPRFYSISSSAKYYNWISPSVSSSSSSSSSNNTINSTHNTNNINSNIISSSASSSSSSSSLSSVQNSLSTNGHSPISSTDNSSSSFLIDQSSVDITGSPRRPGTLCKDTLNLFSLFSKFTGFETTSNHNNQANNQNTANNATNYLNNFITSVNNNINDSNNNNNNNYKDKDKSNSISSKQRIGSSVSGSNNKVIAVNGNRSESIRIDLTVAVVSYTTGSGAQHYGVCSNFLANIKDGHQVFGFLRSAPNFRMPDDHSAPVIMVGPGTGIAPFRAFWLERYAEGLTNPSLKKSFGKMSLYFGCRSPLMELYCDETRFMTKEKILSNVKVAYSRVAGQPKRYVQDELRSSTKEVLHQLMKEKGHLYVCGDVSMAEGVCQTLRQLLSEAGYEDPDGVIMYLRSDNRYHEDIFGITLRTDEVRKKGRDNALNRKSAANA